MPNVVAFSGGRTSALMLRYLLDKGLKPIVLFANTGKERDETLDFVQNVSEKWGVEVVWLQYKRIPMTTEITQHLKTKRMRDYAEKQQDIHWFETVTFETAARHSDNHTPFDELLNWMTVLPNPRVRACTAQLKVRTMQRYLWSIGVTQFVNHIGFRADEPDRAYDLMFSADRDKDVRLSFPLVSAGITEPDVRDFWDRQTFDLQLDPYEGNCHLCFLKKRSVKQRLIAEQPLLSQWWEDQEKKKEASGAATGARWSIGKGHSIAELRAEAMESLVEPIDPMPMDCCCTSAMSLASVIEEDDI